MSSSRQVAVTRQDVQEAIDEARRLWPWVRKDSQAVAAVAAHWLNGRRDDSRRAAQERTEQALAELQRDMALVKRRLGIGEEDDSN